MDKDVIASLVAQAKAKGLPPPKDKSPRVINETVTVCVNTVTYFDVPIPTGD